MYIICIYLYVLPYVYIYIYVHVYVYICIDTCMYTHVYMYKYMYIHIRMNAVFSYLVQVPLIRFSAILSGLNNVHLMFIQIVHV